MSKARVERKQFTARVPTKLYEQLQLVAATSNKTMNKVLEAALREHLAVRSRELAEEISPRLEKLRRYAQDPGNRRSALAALVRDEAKYAADDPAEGSRITEDAIT